MISELHALNSECRHIYAQYYFGLAKQLGFSVLDESCAQPERCFYFPSRPKDSAPPQGTYEDEGKFLDWSTITKADIPRRGIKKKDERTGAYVPRQPGDLVCFDKNNARIDLLAWDKQFGQQFDMAAFLEQHLPEEMQKGQRAQGKSGIHIECPYESEHSTVGGVGTWAAPAEDERPWMISCIHNSCSKRGRFDFLKKLIQDGHITREDLGLAAVAGAVPEQSIKPTHEQHDEGVVALVLDQDASSAEKIKDQVYRAIQISRYPAQARGALNVLITQGIGFDLDAIVECLSTETCGLGKRGLVLLHRDYSPHLGGIDRDTFLQRIAETRRNSRPVAQAVEEVIQDGCSGMVLDERIQFFANWYMVPEKSFRREYSLALKAIDQENTDARILKLHAEWREQYALLHIGDKLVVLDTIATRRQRKPVWYGKDAIAYDMRSTNIPTIVEDPKREGKQKVIKVNAWKAFIDDCRERQSYKGLTFDPNEPHPRTSAGHYNTFVPGEWAIYPRAGDATPILYHLKEVWCSGREAEYNWLMTWLADIFQNPGNKPPSAILLMGGQGTGKSLPCQHGLQRMLGQWYGVSADRETITGKFNGYAAGKLLFLGEEALFSGDKQSTNKLKDVISRDTIDVEYKGKEKFQAPNHCRYIFTSNHAHPIHMDKDERRFLPLRTSDRHKQDIRYNGELEAWLKDGGAEIWLDYLLKWDPAKVGLTWKALHRAPMTPEKRAQIEMSRDAADQFFVDILCHGRLTTLPVNLIPDHKIEWGLDDELKLPRESFRACFDQYVAAKAGAAAAPHIAKLYGAKFEEWIGAQITTLRTTMRIATDAVGGEAPVGAIKLPPRREVLRRAVAIDLLEQADLDWAIANPTSHRMKSF